MPSRARAFCAGQRFSARSRRKMAWEILRLRQRIASARVLPAELAAVVGPPDDLAAAYKQLLAVERGWRDLEGALRLRPGLPLPRGPDPGPCPPVLARAAAHPGGRERHRRHLAQHPPRAGPDAPGHPGHPRRPRRANARPLRPGRRRSSTPSTCPTRPGSSTSPSRPPTEHGSCNRRPARPVVTRPHARQTRICAGPTLNSARSYAHHLRKSGQTRDRIEGFLVGDHNDLAGEYDARRRGNSRTARCRCGRPRSTGSRTPSTPSSGSCVVRKPGDSRPSLRRGADGPHGAGGSRCSRPRAETAVR